MLVASMRIRTRRAHSLQPCRGAMEQFAADVAFVDRALRGEAILRSISYVVLGTDTWKTTTVWPPAGVKNQLLNLSPSLLAADAVQPAAGTYPVDFASTSGAYNRW